ncbi:nuclear RNA-splicing-associated protein-domain-containing protein [Powellomyces hirtus]|nr:nuclear RNA-splicing-associated protein-domain-containing protein [Powellomyces hirtus]
MGSDKSPDRMSRRHHTYDSHHDRESHDHHHSSDRREKRRHRSRSERRQRRGSHSHSSHSHERSEKSKTKHYRHRSRSVSSSRSDSSTSDSPTRHHSHHHHSGKKDEHRHKKAKKSRKEEREERHNHVGDKKRKKKAEKLKEKEHHHGHQPGHHHHHHAVEGLATGILDLVESELTGEKRSAVRLGGKQDTHPPPALPVHNPIHTAAVDVKAVPKRVSASSAGGGGGRRPLAVPQTRAEYEQEQSTVREVFDPLSGRTRLVKGSGEIIERIVTKAQHREINRVATAGDGATYAGTLGKLAG